MMRSQFLKWPSRRSLGIWAGMSVLVFSAVAGAQTASNRVEAQPTAAAVNAAMKRAVAFLLSQKDGNTFNTNKLPWGPDKETPETGGETALVLYALLHTGKSLNDSRLAPTSPELAPVMDYLAGLHPDGTYAAALTTLALSFAPPGVENRKRIAPAFSYLMRTMDREPKMLKRNGGFSYHAPASDAERAAIYLGMIKQCEAVDPQNQILTFLRSQYGFASQGKGPKQWGYTDGSNTQYGVLAIWAAQQFGVEVGLGVWGTLDGYWRRSQQKDGSFIYNVEDTNAPHSVTMCAAGVASLYITTAQLDQEVRLEPHEDRAIGNGVARVIADFNPKLNDLYYLYALERVGLASGLKFFGTRNWFREVAANVISLQNPDGSFNGYFYGTRPTLNTAYALLILARGQNAIPFNKLESKGPWNARRSDDANLVDWIGKRYEREFNWQSVNLQVPPEEWMDAPILLITGSKALTLTPEDEAKLKRYIEMGGIIFSSTDGGAKDGAAFDTSVRALLGRLYPKNPARALKPDDVLFSATLGENKLDKPPNVIGVHNGARYLWLHTTEDMGAEWQRRGYAKTEDFVFPRNLYFYAVSLNLTRTRLDDVVVRPGDAPTQAVIKITQVKLGTREEVEPYAWQRMALIAKADLLTDVTLKRATPAEIAVEKPALATLSGVGSFTASQTEISGLRTYLQSGGMLFGDAMGSDPAFSTSFNRLMHQVLPDSALESISSDDDLLTAKNPGAAVLSEIKFRRYARKIHGTSIGMSPKLRGIKIANRWAVVFSEYDITSGLLGSDTWGIDGYSAESSEALAKNILIYARAKNTPH